jgi:hypothetical protein
MFNSIRQQTKYVLNNAANEAAQKAAAALATQVNQGQNNHPNLGIDADLLNDIEKKWQGGLIFILTYG